MVGWGHRGYGGSGTELFGTNLRTGANTTGDAEVLKDKRNVTEKEEKREETRDKIKDPNVGKGPHPLYRAGIPGKCTHCRRNRRSLMRIVQRKIIVHRNLLTMTNPP